MPESIHLCPFPVADQSRRDRGLEARMQATVKAVSMGRSLRTEYSLKTRQPLSALHIVTRDAAERAALAGMEDLIREELNVKTVIFRENEEELVEYRAKANFRVLGKLLGKSMKAAAARIEALTVPEIRSLLDGRPLSIEVDGQAVTLPPDGVEVVRSEKENLKVINEGSLTVALDPVLTPALVQEGIVRDLVRGIQNLRKESGLEVTDRIELALDGPAAVREAAEAFREHLLAETLAVSVEWRKADGASPVECGDETCSVYVRRAAR
jgi:isoleucyl-tRNA synthetase